MHLTSHDVSQLEQIRRTNIRDQTLGFIGLATFPIWVYLLLSQWRDSWCLSIILGPLAVFSLAAGENTLRLLRPHPAKAARILNGSKPTVITEAVVIGNDGELPFQWSIEVLDPVTKQPRYVHCNTEELGPLEPGLRFTVYGFGKPECPLGKCALLVNHSDQSRYWREDFNYDLQSDRYYIAPDPM